MPSSTNTRNNLEAQINVELERVRRIREERAKQQTQAEAEAWQPTSKLQKVAYIALSELIVSGTDDKKLAIPEDQHLKNLVIDFLLEPGKTNEEKQEEIAALYQALLDKFGSFTWVPMIYRNNNSGKFYIPHHREEAEFVYTDGPWRNGLLKGGEGSGKSVAGVVKDLERLRRRMNGLLTSPDLPHFKKSLWPEFKRWCPWDQVVKDQQRRGREEWEPDEPFTLTFKNKAQAVCGGMDNPGSWEGPNVSWAHLDEARRKKDPQALKVLAGRIRIKGPGGELPQLWLTTTPRKNWLFEYFAPWDKPDEPDPHADFKAKSKTETLKTEDNEVNTYVGFAQDRGSGLNETEKNVLLNAEWEDITDTEKFLPSMLLWDGCLDPDLPPYNPRQAMVLAADGATMNDTFFVVGICRHPIFKDEWAIRYSRVWKPAPGNPVSLNAVKEELIELKKHCYIVEIAYDPFQLKSMMEELYQKHGILTYEFSQMAPREKADKQLLDMITNRQIRHDGKFKDLREHIDNANRKNSGVEGDQKMRIVKREASMKIDGAVALSMALDRAKAWNIS